jgi:hypothetical protein
VRTCRIVSEAEIEIAEASLHYELQQAGLGVDFTQEVRLALQRMVDKHRTWERISSSTQREIRWLTTSRFPYVVVYEVFVHELVVLAVAHQHRRPGFWRGRTP